MRKPLVTIVTVCYNLIDAGRVNSFEKCIESVHYQTYDNIEHIIVDGASTDGTLLMIKKYEDQGWVKCFSEPDDGIYDAMTKGVRLANGDYVYFLNTDDYFFDKNVVQDIVKEFEISNVAAIYGNLIPNVSDENRHFTNVFGTEKEIKLKQLQNKNLLLFDNIHHQTIFYKREIFNKVSFFDENIVNGSDWLFNCEAFLKQKYSYKYIDRVITVFSLGGFSTNQSIDIIKKEYNDLREYLNEKFSKYIDVNDIEYKKYFLKKKNLKFLGITLIKILENKLIKKIYLLGFIKIYEKIKFGEYHEV